ncbi:restriction endonuclease subunit S [Sulfurovum sp. zt1-1]|uniref:Restriction endonuclease subunit S n=1 Tax=Sulfurovum zhangzhouensis TaxID=3019067 RepID=A0ABT7QVC7_9BACT|nr:restriction endonuclease subunit S [Sulfurovum zhangzhouensis]
MSKAVKFSNFALDPKLGLKDYSVLHIKNGIYLKNVLLNKNVETDIKSGRTPSKFNEDYWNGEYDFFTMQDIDNSTYILNNKSSEQITDYAIDNEKTLYMVPRNSLIVSNAMTIGLAFITQRDIFINQNVFHINLDDDLVNKIFLKWYFNLVFRPKFKKLFASKYLSKDEFGRLLIPNIPLDIQIHLVEKIVPIEQEIQNLKSQKKEHLEIINEVFAEEYKYSKNLWKEFGKGMTAGTQKSYDKTFRIYTMPFSQMNESNIFRFSSRFHNPLTRKIEKIFHSKNTIKLKTILEQDIKRGVSPKYDENGDIPVVKTGQLKNGNIDLIDCEFVNEDFFTLKEKAQIKENDILIASTGKVSLGKIDINEQDEQDLIADGHVSIVRVNNNYNPLFLTYFLRSLLGTYQIERDYTGATNQIELYVNEIKNFYIPDFTLKKQHKIAEQIKFQIDAQKMIDEQIKQKQKEISDIVYSVIEES